MGRRYRLKIGFAGPLVRPGPGEPVILIDPNTNLQTMIGLSGHSSMGNNATCWDAIADLAAENGIRGARVEIRSGDLNTIDVEEEYALSNITEEEYRDLRYAPKNGGTFQSYLMDLQMVNYVARLEAELATRSQPIWINLTIVDFWQQEVPYLGDFQMRQSPAKMAELVLGAVQHMNTVYTRVPDEITLINEPDGGAAGWSSAQLAAVVKAVGDALWGAGFEIPLAVPGTTREYNAIPYFDACWDYESPTFPNRVYLSGGRITYHRYSGQDVEETKAIGARALALGIKSGMSEWIQATADTMWQDLKWGNNSLWEQYTIGGGGTNAAGKLSYIGFDPDAGDPPSTVFARNELKKMQQVFRFVRRDAIRKAVTHTNCGNVDVSYEFYNFDGLAFLNTNGFYAVVVRTRTSGIFHIDGLPAGTYGIEYTQGTTWHLTLSDVVINAGDALPVTSPTSTVTFWTAYRKS